jgi:hypothetical protein
MKSDASLEADVALVMKQARFLIGACDSIRRPDCQGDWDYGVAMTKACWAQLKRIFEDEGLAEKLEDPEHWSYANRMKEST